MSEVQARLSAVLAGANESRTFLTQVGRQLYCCASTFVFRLYECVRWTPSSAHSQTLLPDGFGARTPDLQNAQARHVPLVDSVAAFEAGPSKSDPKSGKRKMEGEPEEGFPGGWPAISVVLHPVSISVCCFQMRGNQRLRPRKLRASLQKAGPRPLPSSRTALPS